MKRREALQHIFIVGGAIWLFPKCAGGPDNQGQAFLNESHQKLLADIAEVIIPTTTNPGAKELGVQYFIEKMVSDCRSPDYQKAFMWGLEKFEDFAEKKIGKKWVNLNAAQKLEILKYGASELHPDSDVQTFIKGVRELTINGYKNSKYYLTKVQEYQLVPGHFYGCAKLSIKKF